MTVAVSNLAAAYDIMKSDCPDMYSAVETLIEENKKMGLSGDSPAHSR